MTALRLHKTREAFQNHDLTTALLEAEELLDEDPHNITALEVLGDIELEMGHGREASLVYQALLRTDPDNASYLGGLTIARFLETDFEGALVSGQRAVELAPEMAEAHAYLALANERLGQHEAARRSMDCASKLDPETYRPPIPQEQVPWSALLTEALALLPSALRSFYERVPVVWHDLPDTGVLRATDPPITPLVLALYEGSPSDEGRGAGLLPRSMRIYQGNARRFAHDMQRLAADLGQALGFEAADWLGIPFPLEEEEE